MSRGRLSRAAIASSDADAIVVTATGFSGLLSGTDTTLAAALATLDSVVASDITVTATGFSGELGVSDTDVQTALDTLDAHTHA